MPSRLLRDTRAVAMVEFALILAILAPAAIYIGTQAGPLLEKRAAAQQATLDQAEQLLADLEAATT